MKLRKWLTVVTVCASLWACGGGGSGEGDPTSATLAGDGSENWPSAKYAGTWSGCMSAGGPTMTKRETFDIEAIAPNLLRYRQSRTYHSSSDCTGSPSRPEPYSGPGTFELLGGSTTVNGVESETTTWTNEQPSDFANTGSEKSTLGIKDGVLYIGDIYYGVDAEGFPTSYYHVLPRVN